MRYNMRHMAELYRRIAVLACFVCVLVCAGGCETVAKIFAPDDEVGAVDPVYFEPRVRPGVALVVVVSAGGSAQPATMQVQVDQNGDLTLPLLLQSPVACDGLTLDALRQKLVKLYSDYYKQPQVTVTFAPYDGKGVSPWGTVTVLGEVASPGPVNMPSTMDLTVTKVLQAAGCGVCPSDAVDEAKAVADIISTKPGGKGCIREVIEQTLKAQGKWVFDTGMYKKTF